MSERLYVGSQDDFPEGGRKLIQAGETVIGVFRKDGQFYAYENRCPHQGGPVCYGSILGKVEAVLEADMNVIGERFSEDEIHLICPWHGYEYDLSTGICTVDQRLRLRNYEVLEEKGNLYVVV